MEEQPIYVVLQDSINKLHERLSAMGKFITDSNAAFNNTIREVIKPRTYALRPNKSESIGDLAKALSQVQLEIGAIQKGTIANRGKFANLSDIFEVTVPALQKHELATTFHLDMDEYGGFVLRLNLMHSSGQWMETTAPLHEEEALRPVDSLHQRVGAAEKYLRRYMYRAMLNLAEDSE